LSSFRSVILVESTNHYPVNLRRSYMSKTPAQPSSRRESALIIVRRSTDVKSEPTHVGFYAVATALALATLASQAAAPKPPEAHPSIDQARFAVDWSKFLARHDLVWATLPRVWHEAAFLGNGLVGATIYRDSTNALQWDVGRSDVTDRGGRVAIGRFILVPEGADPKGTMRLDLWNAEARGTLRTTEAQVEWRSFAHASNLVTVIELTERKGSPPAKLVFQQLPALPAREEYRNEPVSEDLLNPSPVFGETGTVHWCLQTFKAGGGYSVAWAERELSPGRRAFWFSVEYAQTGAPGSAKAVANVQAALVADFDETIRTHRAWWHSYYPQSFLSLPDTRLESFYWIQMYKLASATRGDRPALDLMGPWFRRTPWPKIWWNLNIQLTYWPVYAANRLALGESLIRLIDDHRGALIHNVPAEWQTDSAKARSVGT
jgi:alpha-L-fucosidase 2